VPDDTYALVAQFMKANLDWDLGAVVDEDDLNADLVLFKS
jgi:hypothetical protein